MAAMSKTRLWTWIAVAVWVTLIAVLLATDSGRSVGKALLASTLLIAVGWIAIEFGYKKWRQKRQNAFDENLAAREGVDDRRREWSTWTDELNRQGIDRYQLPFYLLVGEPQGGKSILLHNSELHFPFGQSRLSGLGGTRGCDWWFTEEAVILDVAGRLFTHEGGASDAAEWEAFLDLLVGYRPLSPANGILLVLPCDSLLGDSPETTTDKARRIQDTLLTLANKLQAQIPVYVVMTKADKIFGFAECVHRLDAKRRLEMFGWSRPAGLVDSPFSQSEVQDGFEEIVQRARVLRSNMVATAQIPEALGEVDRLYAFPDELESMWPAIDRYLTQIFTESSLVDRLYFRGLYLTSGLQSGAPIAKACAELVGENSESDQRDLEAIFSQQRAYFIRDLVKSRVFGERGLVRPTDRRLKAARTRQWVAYGAAGFLTLTSMAGAAWYLMRGRGDDLVAKYSVAIDATRTGDVVNAYEGIPLTEASRRLGGVEESLVAIDDAIRHPSGGLERIFKGAKTSFHGLFAKVFDQRYAPLVRHVAEGRLLEESRGAPDSEREFKEGVKRAIFLMDTNPRPMGGEGTTEEEWLTLLTIAEIDSDSSVSGVEGSLAPREARERRRFFDVEPSAIEEPVLSDELQEATGIFEGRFEGLLDPVQGHLAEGAVGFVAAWDGTRTLFNELSAEIPNERGSALSRPEFLAKCRDYAVASSALSRRLNSLDAPPTSAPQDHLRDIDITLLFTEFGRLKELHGFFHLAKYGESAEDNSDWDSATGFEEFAQSLLRDTKSADGQPINLKALLPKVSLRDLRGRRAPTPSMRSARSVRLSDVTLPTRTAVQETGLVSISVREVETRFLDPDLLRVAEPGDMDRGGGAPQEVLEELRVFGQILSAGGDGNLLERARRNLALAQAIDAGNAFISNYPNWRRLKQAIEADDTIPMSIATETYCHDLVGILESFESVELQPWVDHLRQCLVEGDLEKQTYLDQLKERSENEPLNFGPQGETPWGEISAIGSGFGDDDAIRARRIAEYLALIASDRVPDLTTFRPSSGAYTGSSIKQIGDDHGQLQLLAGELGTERLEENGDLAAYGKYLAVRDGQLLTRLEGHRARLESKWKTVEVDNWSTLSTASRGTLEAVSETGVGELFRSLDDEQAPRSLREAAGASSRLVQSEAFLSTTLMPWLSAGYSVGELTGRPASIHLASYANEVSASNQGNRSELPAIYGKYRVLPGVEGPGADPWHDRLKLLKEGLDAKVLEEISRSFLREFRAQFLQRGEPGNPTDWEVVAEAISRDKLESRTPPPTGDQTALTTRLQRMFRANGQLSRFQASEGWTDAWGSEGGSTLGGMITEWIKDNEVALTDAEYSSWGLFQFMSNFQAFLGPSVEEGETRGPWQAKITIAAIRDPSDRKSVWNAANEVSRNNFSHRYHGSGTTWERSATLSQVRELVIEPWSYIDDTDSAEARRLAFRWAKDGTDADLGPENQDEIAFYSSLAPALLVWNHAYGSPVDAGPRTEWDIRFPVKLSINDVTDKTQYYVDMRVTFDRPLPMRPDFARF